MYLNCFEEVKEITTNLVKIPSIVKTSGETKCAEKIYEYYKNLPYFKENQEYLLMEKTEKDEIERHNVIAMVRGTKGESNKTLLLMGHLDTVGIDDFGTIKEYAFDPIKLPELLRNMNLGEEVNRDIDSGEYMFGRGALDMKAGVAGHMYLIKYFSEHPEELNGNLIALAECDEEDNSHGAISALKILREWKERYNFEYIAAINADYSTPYHEKDENRYIYFGTIGKLLPSFYVTGKETHVGQAFGGLDPNLIVAEITRQMDLNPDLCDEAQGEITIPPVSLKQADFKDIYTVQTPLAAYSYYNFFVHRMSPTDVMEKVKEKAIEAFDNVIEYLNDSYKKFCEISGYTYTELPWRTRVYTWEEFYNELATIHGNKFIAYIHNFAKELNEKEPAMDLRKFSVRIVDEAWKWTVDKSPVIIIYYSSTFCARIEVTGEEEKEKLLIDSVKESINFVQEYSDKPIVTKMFYPYISDMSFMGMSDSVESLKTLKQNMPAWGSKYVHPIEEILDINVPVVNIGTFGKDGHKITERVHMRYTFENVSNITYNTIKKLLS
ncbi:M20/M25/M40 family metallo-hydrolase [Tissierella sp. MSJ-40]|uniref:M20/M25/M40 family metallo-hydrolase n=1 Tax=Tissierella simiarum TaxID=2841534 RepID=A0ABS6E3Q5_9FIRM|nr:M20/M25/M40 family metallo-hydrolase [Tissierella simiarum]MBU5436883.1 M20/M25/M40 family metallo-hydrolase [Tissierella simiarum]